MSVLSVGGVIESFVEDVASKIVLTKEKSSNLFVYSRTIRRILYVSCASISDFFSNLFSTNIERRIVFKFKP